MLYQLFLRKMNQITVSNLQLAFLGLFTELQQMFWFDVRKNVHESLKNSSLWKVES